jgi:hypothetical protein
VLLRVVPNNLMGLFDFKLRIAKNCSQFIGWVASSPLMVMVVTGLGKKITRWESALVCLVLLAWPGG